MKGLKVNRNFVMLGAAVVVGGIGFYLANGFIQDEVSRARAELAQGDEQVEVVVMTHDLPKGTRIAAEDLAVRKVPAKWVHKGVVTPDTYTDAEGQRVSFDVEEGKPLLWAHLEAGRVPTFSGRVPEGMRALTFPVDEVSSISGFLQPGDKIDLLLTYRPTKDDVTLPLLEGVPVLATGTRTVVDKSGGGGDATLTYTTVTVQVSPEDAKRITLAQEAGKLTAVLRHPDDKGGLTKDPMTVAKLFGSVPKSTGVIPAKRPAEPAPAPKEPGVQFIIGGV